jgi:hypothetical protein
LGAGGGEGGRREGLRVERERIASLSSADFLFWNWKKLGILLTLILEKKANLDW